MDEEKTTNQVTAPRSTRRAEIPEAPAVAEPIMQAAKPMPRPAKESGIDRWLSGPQPEVQADLKINDVVQIISPQHTLYGGFFVVGDILRGKVHGWAMVEGRRTLFVTLDEKDVFYIGTAKIRSRTGCSPKWISDNRPGARR